MEKAFIFFLSVLLFLVGIQFFLFSIYAPRLVNGQKLSFVTTILDEPKNQGYISQLPVFYGNVFGKQRILINTNSIEEFIYGEIVCISGKVSKRVLTKSTSIHTLNAQKIEANYAQENFLLAVTNLIRQKVKQEYFSVLPQSQANLLFGVVLGIKREFFK